MLCDTKRRKQKWESNGPPRLMPNTTHPHDAKEAGGFCFDERPMKMKLRLFCLLFPATACTTIMAFFFFFFQGIVSALLLTHISTDCCFLFFLLRFQEQTADGHAACSILLQPQPSHYSHASFPQSPSLLLQAFPSYSPLAAVCRGFGPVRGVNEAARCRRWQLYRRGGEPEHEKMI